jgi:hypothetical protein
MEGGVAFTAQKVVFPFGEALPAAAALWHLSSTISSAEPARQSAAKTALDGWQGTFANNFVSSMDNSAQSASDVMTALQQAALDLASAWTQANHQQQTYIYYAMVQYKKNQQSTLDQIGNWLFGDHTNYGSPPGAPEPPGPPSFAPTFVPQASVPGVNEWPELTG